MKAFLSYILVLLVVFSAGVFCLMDSAHAAMDFTTVTVSTADVFTWAGIILTAIGAIWAIRKLVKLGNKS